MIKIISYRLQFIDSSRFMANSLSNIVINNAEGIHKIKCKYDHDDKNCETCEIKYKDCLSFLEHTHFKYDLIKINVYVVIRIKNEILKKQFFNTYKLSNHDINKVLFTVAKTFLPL